MKERFNIDQQVIDDLYNEENELFFYNAYYLADYFVSMTNINNIKTAPLDLTNKDDFLLYVKMKIMYYASMNSYLSIRKLSHVAADPMWRFIKSNIYNKLNPGKFYDYIYMSAHDSTIMELLTGVQYFDPKCYIDFVVNYSKSDDKRLVNDVGGICVRTPNVASSLMFELVQRKDEKIVVRMAWDG